MIELPELLIVLGVFALMGGYIALIRFMLAHADGNSDADTTAVKRGKS